jgi:hypothetical protein
VTDGSRDGWDRPGGFFSKVARTVLIDTFHATESVNYVDFDEVDTISTRIPAIDSKTPLAASASSS